MAQDDIFDHSVGGYQFAVLVDHADAHINGIQRRFEIDLFPANVNFAFIGLQ